MQTAKQKKALVALLTDFLVSSKPEEGWTEFPISKNTKTVYIYKHNDIISISEEDKGLTKTVNQKIFNKVAEMPLNGNKLYVKGTLNCVEKTPIRAERGFITNLTNYVKNNPESAHVTSIILSLIRRDKTLVAGLKDRTETVLAFLNAIPSSLMSPYTLFPLNGTILNGQPFMELETPTASWKINGKEFLSNETNFIDTSKLLVGDELEVHGEKYVVSERTFLSQDVLFDISYEKWNSKAIKAWKKGVDSTFMEYEDSKEDKTFQITIRHNVFAGLISAAFENFTGLSRKSNNGTVFYEEGTKADRGVIKNKILPKLGLMRFEKNALVPDNNPGLSSINTQMEETVFVNIRHQCSLTAKVFSGKFMGIPTSKEVTNEDGTITQVNTISEVVQVFEAPYSIHVNDSGVEIVRGKYKKFFSLSELAELSNLADIAATVLASAPKFISENEELKNSFYTELKTKLEESLGEIKFDVQSATVRTSNRGRKTFATYSIGDTIEFETIKL